MLFVTFALAQADQADQAAPEPCAPWLSATWPVQGASDVPVDIAPTALFETCGSHTDVLATVVDGTETVVWSGILAPTFAGDTAILELPQLALADGTSYRVDLEADGYPVSFGFTAGPTAAVALTDGPTLEL
ncbi:MAG: hypothetical protein KC656_29105, partial [Myxococcales bacterium]|nr:hypothetical protein [Myxococcales bacterium]